MNQVVLLLGSMLIGALSEASGAPWASASLSIIGIVCMVGLYILAPRARKIR
jgi:hypothetical protein